jgi:uncharacterized membrane protein
MSSEKGPARPPVTPAHDADKLPHHAGLVAQIRTYFLTGLVLVAPVFITAYLLWWFVNWVDDLVRPFIPVLYRPETYMPVKIPGSGLIIAFVTLTLLGAVTTNIVGRKLVAVGDDLLHRMPIVRPIYRTMKQIFETIFSNSGSSFRKVGLVEFPAPGMWSLVFMSQSPSADVAERLPTGEHVSVFLPCTPNPTTGFFFYLPRADIIELDISVEAAMTVLMSAGMVQPSSDPQKKFAAMAETAMAGKAMQARAKESAA